MWINCIFLLVLTAFKIPKFEKTTGRYGIWINWAKFLSSRPSNVTSPNDSRGLSFRVCFWGFISASSLGWIPLFRIFMFIVQRRVLNFDSCELSPSKCHLAYDSSYKQCMLSRGHVYVVLLVTFYVIFPRETTSKCVHWKEQLSWSAVRYFCTPRNIFLWLRGESLSVHGVVHPSLLNGGKRD